MRVDPIITVFSDRNVIGTGILSFLLGLERELLNKVPIVLLIGAAFEGALCTHQIQMRMKIWVPYHIEIS